MVSNFTLNLGNINIDKQPVSNNDSKSVININKPGPGSNKNVIDVNMNNNINDIYNNNNPVKIQNKIPEDVQMVDEV